MANIIKSHIGVVLFSLTSYVWRYRASLHFKIQTYQGWTITILWRIRNGTQTLHTTGTSFFLALHTKGKKCHFIPVTSYQCISYLMILHTTALHTSALHTKWYFIPSHFIPSALHTKCTSYQKSLHTRSHFIPSAISYQKSLHTRSHFIPKVTSYQNLPWPKFTLTQISP